jgi:hypothetical protein
MGANAQTAVPAFVAGEVLTAAEMTQVNTGIPVFATTTTRDAAFGGAGEKTLAEGQFAYIEATNTTQYYDGAAWQPVGVSPGLVCVKAETTFTGVSSFTADNVFTSNYTNYLMILNYATSTTNQVFAQLRVGGVAAATNYNYQESFAYTTVVGASRATGQTSIKIGDDTNSISENAISHIQINTPQLAQATHFASNNSCNTGGYNAPLVSLKYGNHSTATAYDGIGVLVATGTMTGTYAIYGYSKTV